MTTPKTSSRSTLRRRRIPLVAAVSGALLATLATTAPGAAADGRLLDTEALRRSIAGLPDDDVTGALVRVAGSDGYWWGTSGFADVRTQEAVRSDSSFRIGSITKLFTGTVVLQLAAEGRVDLDAPVLRYLPGLLPEAYSDVKVGQLLDHTSGLPAPSSLTYGDGSNEWFVRHRFESWTPEQIVREALRGERQFPAGTAQQYNGINSYVAGLLIEEVTGRSYASEVRSRIVRPLGLRRTYVPEAHDMTLPGPHAHGYRAVGDGLADVTKQSPYAWAEGGMISTAADLDRFTAALLGGRLLPPEQQKLLFRLPDPKKVVNLRNPHCANPAGPAAPSAPCFSLGGLMRAVLPNGTPEGLEVWGKTGSAPGYTNAVFTTRDLSRRVVYSFNYTAPEGRTELPYVLRILSAAFASKQ
ncbi:serine hydrolase domain-containing protein [Streptomyces sp. NPDC049577]|uniref:serine hydrolase domain-containing protein n=1 Tax=Streptomyces sp. NPDC049577 TaxID=3155153 RepID=UPI003415209D